MVDEKIVSKDALERKIACPECGETMMQVYLNYNGSTILIDNCNGCGGYWHDKGELDKVLGEDELEKMLNLKMPNRSGSRFPCPRCGGDLAVKMLLNVEIDQCRSCSGVWLDRDEIGRIKAACRAGMETNTLVDLINKME